MYKRNFFFISSVFLLFLLGSCHRAVELKDKRVGFYYWQTALSIDEQKKQYMDAVRCNLLYVRLFDIDTQQIANGEVKVSPKSIIQLIDTIPAAIEIVPVVYITRQAIKEIKSVDTMADNMERLVMSVMQNYQWQFKEIQWDFDWTPSTKDVYFALLKKLKSKPFFTSKKFSCTIRLHQIKHVSQAGIPPVDKGLLMCYNMGNLKQYGIENSIIDEKTTKSYLENMQYYPLKLDVAFPLFSWALLFRNKQFVSILNDVTIGDINEKNDFVKTKNGMYQAQNNINVNGFEIQQHDEIRCESVDTKTLKNIVQYVCQHNNNDSIKLVFFSLKQPEIVKYPTHELQEIINAY